MPIKGVLTAGYLVTVGALEGSFDWFFFGMSFKMAIIVAFTNLITVLTFDGTFFGLRFCMNFFMFFQIFTIFKNLTTNIALEFLVVIFLMSFESM
jgi:Zn-dependent protease